jgi:hypothetical protein
MWKYITDQVLSAFENVYPFNEINLDTLFNSNHLNSDNGGINTPGYDHGSNISGSNAGEGFNSNTGTGGTRS